MPGSRNVVLALFAAGAVAVACARGETWRPARSVERPATTRLSASRAATFASCEELNQWDGVIESGNVIFPRGCAYYGQIKFAAPGLTLDCNAGFIEGSPDGNVIVKAVEPSVDGAWNNPHARNAVYRRIKGTTLEPLLAGIVVARPEAVAGECRPGGPVIEDITIENCTIRGFFHGISLAPELGEVKAGSGKCERVSQRHYYDGYDVSRARNYSYEEEYAFERSELYQRAPKHVRIMNSIVERNGHAGINVAAYSQFFSIEGTTIRNNGSVGVYLSEETRYTAIRRSSIVHNGWGSEDRLVDYHVPGAGIVMRKSREGIAIDASAHNTLSLNLIAENFAGGIALYKNCGERHSARAPALIRRQHSDYNRILHNTIVRHAKRPRWQKSGYGVSVASRQGLPFDPKEGAFAHCRDPSVVTPSGERRNRDYAKFNVIAYNTFEDNWCSLRIADDFNQIVGNEFRGTTKYDLYIGNDFRNEIGLPVRGTVLVENRSWSQTDAKAEAGNGTELHCFDANDGAAFNDCVQTSGH